MPVLNDTQRAGISRAFQKSASSAHESLGLTKIQVKAAIDAADDWVVANASSFNTALPIAARTALSVAQKSRLLTVVAQHRFAAGE